MRGREEGQLRQVRRGPGPRVRRRTRSRPPRRSRPSNFKGCAVDFVHDPLTGAVLSAAALNPASPASRSCNGADSSTPGQLLQRGHLHGRREPHAEPQRARRRGPRVRAVRRRLHLQRSELLHDARDRRTGLLLGQPLPVSTRAPTPSESRARREGRPVQPAALPLLCPGGRSATRSVLDRLGELPGRRVALVAVLGQGLAEDRVPGGRDGGVHFRGRLAGPS